MVIDRFKELYTELTSDSVARLNEVYSDDIVLVDPVGRHSGLDSLRLYFDNLLSNNQQCQFKVHQHIIADGCGTVTWTMHYQHPKLANGKPLTLDGVSELHISADRITYQRDYYDMGEMIYEHLPVLGFVLRQIKNRMKGNQ
ncbi:MAG: nuclear transport factor 2 family protein [Aestuariibacter sp.]